MRDVLHNEDPFSEQHHVNRPREIFGVFRRGEIAA
jgi:hypothetical protein